jgi:hypothetical protein
VDSECGFCNAGPNILGFTLCFVVGVVARDVTVVAEELELLAVVLLLLLEDEVLPLDFERVLIRGSTPSLDLVFRDFDGVAGGGEVVGLGVTVFVRSFLACLDLIFSSSSDEGLGELEPLSRAAAKEGARLSARGFAFLFGGAQIESVRLIRCTRGSSTISGRRRR